MHGEMRDALVVNGERVRLTTKAAHMGRAARHSSIRPAHAKATPYQHRTRLGNQPHPGIESIREIRQTVAAAIHQFPRGCQIIRSQCLANWIFAIA